MFRSFFSLFSLFFIFASTPANCVNKYMQLGGGIGDCTALKSEKGRSCVPRPVGGVKLLLGHSDPEQFEIYVLQITLVGILSLSASWSRGKLSPLRLPC